MDNWRLVEYSSRSPLFNLAVEEALIQLNRLSSPTLRIWRNTQKTVVIGRFQRPEFEVNFGLSAKNGVYVVRRFTGGGAVYHDKGNINFSLIVPEAHPLFCGLGENLYKPLGKIIIEFLRSLNLHAKLKTNSIFVNNKKISGMSGYITPELSFHHATLLVSTDTQFIEEILKGKNYNSTPCVKSKKEPITTINRELKKPLSTAHIVKSIKSIIENLFNIKLKHIPLTIEELKLARKLLNEKYKKEDYAIYIPDGQVLPKYLFPASPSPG